MSVVVAAALPSSVFDNHHDFRVINDWARDSSWLHGFMEAYSGILGLAITAALLLAGWWLARRSASSRRMAAAVWAVVGTGIAVAINQPIVGSVGERRPFVALPHVLLLVHHAPDPGFPSDHATMAGAVLAGLFFVSWRLGIVATFTGLLLAFSRVYVGVHYPGDVLAGLALGAVVSLIGQLVVVPWLTRLVGWSAERTPLRPLLTAGHPPDRDDRGVSAPVR